MITYQQTGKKSGLGKVTNVKSYLAASDLTIESSDLRY
jgi:4-hydroxyproline epimerase